MEAPRATILLVEDHRPTRTFLADNLTVDGYEILEAEGVGDALVTLETKFPDLAIVDLGLPDRDGLDLIAAVRGSEPTAGRIDPELPLVVLSGRGGELNLLRGFGRGADDYITKPLQYQVLRARVGALLRRSRRRPALGRVRAGNLEIDLLSRQVRVGGESVELSNKEFALARALAAEPTRVFTREELLRGVWGFRQAGTTRTLDAHAARLRRKLGVRGDRFVINVWGVGYRLYDGDPR